MRAETFSRKIKRRVTSNFMMVFHYLVAVTLANVNTFDLYVLFINILDLHVKINEDVKRILN